MAARAEIETINVSRVPVDLRANAAQVLEVLPEAHKTRVRFDDERRRIRVLADPVRVRQVVRNLASDALRYGGDDIRVDFELVGQQAVLTVSDNGPGIPESEREQIFLPYHIAHSPGSQPSSVGLGLTVSRQLAGLMGGSLTYRHEAGSSVFEIRLPSASDSDEAAVGYASQPADQMANSV